MKLGQIARHTPKLWHVINGEGESLGRMAARVAMLLSGKRKPTYHPSQVCSDYVVVLNAAKLSMPPQKLETKVYRHHTHYPGGFRETALEDLWARDPADVVRRAVFGMLPKNRNRKKFNRSLFIYPGAEHPHAADIASAPQAPAPVAHGVTVVSASPPVEVLARVRAVLAASGAQTADIAGLTVQRRVV